MSDDDPIRWADGGGPPGALELVRAIERAPVMPPDLRGSIARRLAPPRAPLRTRMIGPALATAVVIGGILLWAWPRPVEPPVPELVPITVDGDVTVRPEPPPVEPPSPFSPSPPTLPVVGAPDLPRPRRAPEELATPSPAEAPLVEAPLIDAAPIATPPSVAPPIQDERLEGCMVRGDSRCIVELLGRGRARGTAQLRALFNAQRELGDRTGGCATVRALLAEPGVPPAQHSMLRHYQSAQCGAELAASAPEPPIDPLPTFASGSGYLEIQSLPWARVFLDGRDTGRNTPLRRLRVSAGRHVIGLRTSGGILHEATVDVPAGETVRIVRQL